MRIHLIGIGGIGVSALARYFLSQSWKVSGSDSSPSPLLRELKAEGAKIYIGHRKNNLNPKTDLVVFTQAIPLDNPELKEAKRLKLKTLTYPQALGWLTKTFTTIAVAGTHGKSTATALTALALIEAKKDPTVIVGTKVPQLRGKNFRSGKSEYLVLEADEYRDAFLNYSPTAALITNIDREHLDYFKNLNQAKKSFRKFINNLSTSEVERLADRVLVLNKDSVPLFQVGRGVSGNRKIVWYSLKEKKLAQKIKKYLHLSGEHNLSNALGVYKLARALGVKEKDILSAFAKYKGAWRRFEYKGDLKIEKWKLKIPVYDDYAHHPTEIKATLSAFREKYPDSKIICVFQPHQAERLKKLFKEFVGAFDEADTLILLDIFKVSGRESKKQQVGSKQLADAIRKRKNSPETIYLPHSARLKQALYKLAQDKSVIVMTGAGNIVDMTPRLLK